MSDIVFFSWQSDHPSAVCRSLIGRSLRDAVRALNASASIEAANRIEVLSDTAGEPGIVPIADTILSRIDQASVVVADLSYVAQRAGGGGIPNPNVMLEFGYALRARSGRRMVAVMNTAFGDPSSQPLPFDLAHLRWPIQFACPSDSDSALRRTVREQLTDALTRALEGILNAADLPHGEAPAPHPHDILLVRKIYDTFPLGFRSFLAQHDFSVQFRATILDPLHEAAEWVGAAYHFNDPVIEGAFDAVRQAATKLTELTTVHVFTSGSHPMVGSVKTEIDREHGLQASTRRAIRRLNVVANALAEAFDYFEEVARSRLPVSSLEDRQSPSS